MSIPSGQYLYNVEVRASFKTVDDNQYTDLCGLDQVVKKAIENEGYDKVEVEILTEYVDQAIVNEDERE